MIMMILFFFDVEIMNFLEQICMTHMDHFENRKPHVKDFQMEFCIIICSIVYCINIIITYR
jgi:hypothetical protein